MSDSDTDRRRTDESDSDHAPRQRLAVGELGSDVTAGGPSGERDTPARDLVCPGDDLGLVARLRIDEQEERGVASIMVDSEQSFGGSSTPGGAWVGGNTGTHSDRKRGFERDRRAAGLDRTAGCDCAGPGHPGDTRVSRGLLSLLCRLPRIEDAGREDEDETGIPTECFDRFLHGIEGCADPGTGPRTGERVLRTNELGRGHR